jgi:hypothetical protein
MPKILLIEIQQASLVLFNVACLYNGILILSLKTLYQAQEHECCTINNKS